MSKEIQSVFHFDIDYNSEQFIDEVQKEFINLSSHASRSALRTS